VGYLITLFRDYHKQHVSIYMWLWGFGIRGRCCDGGAGKWMVDGGVDVMQTTSGDVSMMDVTRRTELRAVAYVCENSLSGLCESRRDR
jgi:hypothetical protein